MRTKNFFKGLAVAAIALVGAFATSCSEENLNVNATGTPVVFPDAVTKAVISVVDLGDMGIGAKTLLTEIKDVAAGSQTFECPAFTGSDQYVIPASQTIVVPALQKGQSITIPVTFYVVKLSSAFANVEYEEVDPGENPDAESLGTDFWGDKAWYGYFAEITEYSGEENEDLMNESDYEKEVEFIYVAKEGRTALEEIVSSRLAATSEEDVIEAYVKNMTDWADESEWDDYFYFTLPSWSFANLFSANFYTKPIIEFTYGSASKSYTFKEYWGAGCGIRGIEEIPNHDHDHDHGHGGNDNAGGGSNEAQ